VGVPEGDKTGPTRGDKRRTGTTKLKYKTGGGREQLKKSRTNQKISGYGNGASAKKVTAVKSHQFGRGEGRAGKGVLEKGVKNSLQGIREDDGSRAKRH